MEPFSLQIVTPDGAVYNGEAIKVRLRTIEGDVGIMAHHINFATALGMGVCRVDLDEKTTRYAACIGGMITVVDGKVTMVATTYEWADDIDIARAEQARTKAEEAEIAESDEEEKRIWQSRKQRALVRLSIAEKYGSFGENS